MASLNARKEDAFVRVIEIIGHTDSRGTKKYNSALGHRSAIAVKEFLLISNKIDEKIEFNTISHGEERPAFDMDENSEEAHSKNRRVDIIQTI